MLAFITAELELISTYLRLARTTEDPEQQKRLLESIKEALTMVRQLEGQIQDRTVWQEVHEKVDRLEEGASRF